MEELTVKLHQAIVLLRVLLAVIGTIYAVALYFFVRGLPELIAAWTDQEEG